MTDTNRAAKLLMKAKTFIEKGWTQGTWARDARGDEVDFEDYKACSWCAMGAVNRASLDEKLSEEDAVRFNALELLRQVIPSHPNPIPHWNDEAETKAEVLEAFDKAIALGRGEEAKHG